MYEGKGDQTIDNPELPTELGGRLQVLCCSQVLYALPTYLPLGMSTAWKAALQRSWVIVCLVLLYPAIAIAMASPVAPTAPFQANYLHWYNYLRYA